MRASTVRLLLALVLALSALVQATVVSRTEVNAPLRVDALDYFSYAVNLRNHGVYSLDRDWMADPTRVPKPDAVRPPGYPLFLATLSPVPNRDWIRRLGYLQSLFAVATVALVFLLGRRFLHPGWALLAALLTAVSPGLVVMSTYVLSETLFTFLLLAALLATESAVRRQERTWPALLAGVAWGLTALVRPTSQFLPALFLAITLLLPALKPWRRTAAMGLLGFVLAMAPWTVRNQLLPAQPDGRSLMVKALAHGSYPYFKYEGREESYGYPYRSDPEAEARARDLPSVLRYIAADFGRHPLRMTGWYLVGKPITFLSWSDPQGWDIFIYPVMRSPYLSSPWLVFSWRAMWWLHAPLCLFAVVASLLSLARPQLLGLSAEARAAAVVPAIVLAYAIAFHMLVAPFPRYNLPFRPLVMLMSALALQAGWRAVEKARLERAAPRAASTHA